MKQLTLNIPENKFELFTEFIKNIEFIKNYNELNISVSEKEQTLVLDRVKKTKKTDLKQWNEILNSFKLK